jgi:uncharacterized protein YdeI (YjbR/CyaY-like superfamily)
LNFLLDGANCRFDASEIWEERKIRPYLYLIKTKMLKKGEHIEGTPPELQVLLDQEPEAMDFFESLSKSYKQGYCDWVGSAKQQDTRKVRADKAMIMLRNKQKTLKT